MFKQKPKYTKPDVHSQLIGIEKVFTASQVPFDSGSVSAESFTQDDDLIYF